MFFRVALHLPSYATPTLCLAAVSAGKIRRSSLNQSKYSNTGGEGAWPAPAQHLTKSLTRLKKATRDGHHARVL